MTSVCSASFVGPLVVVVCFFLLCKGGLNASQEPYCCVCGWYLVDCSFLTKKKRNLWNLRHKVELVQNTNYISSKWKVSYFWIKYILNPLQFYFIFAILYCPCYYFICRSCFIFTVYFFSVFLCLHFNMRIHVSRPPFILCLIL